MPLRDLHFLALRAQKGRKGRLLGPATSSLGTRFERPGVLNQQNEDTWECEVLAKYWLHLAL